jgi:hypothetical protein
MGSGAARNVLLLIAAMAVGFALGAAAKFGFHHDLSLANNPSPKVLAAP